MNRKSNKSLCLALLLFLLLGCSKNDLSPEAQNIVGTWRLHEIGYSPGSGYYTNSVPERPLQSLTFTEKGQLSKEGENLNGMFKAPHYRVNPTQKDWEIEFLDKKKDKSGAIAKFYIKGDTLTVVPPCIEGCHYAFVRIR